ELIARITGFEGKFVWDTSQPDGQPRRAVDGSRAAAAFGWKPAVSLEEGIKQTVEWCEANWDQLTDYAVAGERG
ncbi:MAG TPA: hypothetical protein VHJ82_05240, partial [Actinomycetota bacterium]|nr:hypothetical protein [Actinomycetota bacterium]